nr:ribonuclease H-like domain-containing protein [Tanacetum cinerariifolium]
MPMASPTHHHSTSAQTTPPAAQQSTPPQAASPGAQQLPMAHTTPPVTEQQIPAQIPLSTTQSSIIPNPAQNPNLVSIHPMVTRYRTLVPRPSNTNIVHCIWLFGHKYLADGTLSRYKARLVANGSTQLEMVDVDETFSPVVKPGTFQTILSLDASRHSPIHQLDVKNAFLHDDLFETVGDTSDVVSDLTSYRSLAGSLQYLTFTRSDISYAVLELFSSSTTDLVAYLDADWSCCPTTHRLTFEAEYRGVANAVVETCWLRNLLRELHNPLSSATLVYCDNTSLRDGLRESVSHLPILTDSIIMILVLSSLVEVRLRHGELITIFGAVVKPSLDELSALWLSYSWICDALASHAQRSKRLAHQGGSTTFGSDVVLGAQQFGSEVSDLRLEGGFFEHSLIHSSSTYDQRMEVQCFAIFAKENTLPRNAQADVNQHFFNTKYIPIFHCQSIIELYPKQQLLSPLKPIQSYLPIDVLVSLTQVWILIYQRVHSLTRFNGLVHKLIEHRIMVRGQSHPVFRGLGQVSSESGESPAVWEA